MGDFTLRKRRDTGSWEVDWWENGKRCRKSLGKIPKHLAERKVRLMLEESLLGKPVMVTSQPSVLESVLSRYFEWARNVRNKSENSIKTDKTALKQFLRFAPILDLKEIDGPLIERFISDMKKDGYKPATINIVLRTMKTICNRAVEWNCIPQNPFAKVKQLKTIQKAHIYCTVAQKDLILSLAKKKGRNIHLVCALGFYAGLRKKEISYARWEWFDLQRGLIHVSSEGSFQTKSRKNRTLPLSSKLKEILEQYRDGKTHGYVFEDGNGTKAYLYDFRKPFDFLRMESGLMWVTPHVMRHTFGSLLAQRGVSLYKIAKWMGHSHSGVTEIYAHLQAQDTEIEKL